VCLHGLTGTGARFRKLAEEHLSHRHAIAPDLRGHGESGAEPPWSRETHVRDVLETVDSLGAGDADWIGYSFGGLVCATLAAAEPARVRRLALLEPALGLRPSTALEYASREMEERSYASEDEAIAEMMADDWIFHAPREVLEEEVRTNMVRGDDGRLRYRYSRVAAIAAWSEMAREEPPVADVPTLIVTGERSPLNVDRSRYPDAEVIEVPGGHSVLWDAFDETGAAVRRFLDA
jgi:lipase